VGEFIELYAAVIEEWQPSGPTEAEAVFSLADLMWHKRRASVTLPGDNNSQYSLLYIRINVDA
jgi:hypothetical protein